MKKSSKLNSPFAPAETAKLKGRQWLKARGEKKLFAPPASSAARLAIACLLSLLLYEGAAPASDHPKSASEYSYKAWQAEEELPQSTVTSILQTKDGHLRLGTQIGLVRFEGPGKGTGLGCLWSTASSNSTTD